MILPNEDDVDGNANGDDIADDDVDDPGYLVEAAMGVMMMMIMIMIMIMMIIIIMIMMIAQHEEHLQQPADGARLSRLSFPHPRHARLQHCKGSAAIITTITIVIMVCKQIPTDHIPTGTMWEYELIIKGVNMVHINIMI